MDELADILNQVVEDKLPEGTPKIKRVFHLIVNENGTCGYLGQAGFEEEDVLVLISIANMLKDQLLEEIIDETQETLTGGFKHNTAGKYS